MLLEALVMNICNELETDIRSPGNYLEVVLDYPVTM